MNKYTFTLLVIGALFTLTIPLLPAQEGDIQTSEENVVDLLHNQYLLENARLLELSEKAYAENRFDEAIDYANEAIRYARLSDEYVVLQMKIMETNETMGDARTHMDMAEEMYAPRRYPEIYGEAETTFTEAMDALSREEWDKARELAFRVVAILAQIPDEPLLPARYMVRNWNSTRDCLWNIAGKPEIYGDPLQWRVIYNANRNKLSGSNNPDLILPGIILDIPSIRGEFRAGILEEE